MANSRARLATTIALSAAICFARGWTSTAQAQGLVCGTIDQITFNGLNDQWPDWEPGTERITFNTFSTSSNVPRDIGLVNANGTGYQIAADVVGAPWGTFFPRWAPGNRITSGEHNSIHEYLTFDVSRAPFNRTISNGSDTAFTRELFIPGGDGGGWMVVSADGSTAFWRWSSSGGAGTQQIRRGPLSSLVGQAANSTGVVLQSLFASVNHWIEPIALSPDGTLYINAERTAATANTNLVMRQASDGALVRMITSDAAPGMAARGPDFSPDGSKIAFTYAVGDGQWDLYVENVDGTGRVNITNTPGVNEFYPTWGPNGERIAFTSSDGNDSEIYICSLGGANEPPQITVNTNPLVLEGNATGGYDNSGGLSAAASGVVVSDPDDDVADLTVTNNAPALLPLGDTTVTWTATDPSGDEGMAEQTVTVQDTTAPTVTVPAPINQVATSPLGDPIDYVATAEDVVDPSPTLACVAPSGSTFPLGTTTVECTGEDASGNSSGAIAFDITLVVGQATFAGLVAKIEGMGLNRPLEWLLRAWVRSAARHFAAGRIRAASASLRILSHVITIQEHRFDRAWRAGRQRGLTPAQAQELRECLHALIVGLVAT